MQKSKNTLNKSSTQIQKTIDDRRKSRRRVIGSIVLLCVALAALLNVTAHVKPIPINPDVVEVKDASASAPLANLKANASGTQLVNASSPITDSIESTKSSVVNSPIIVSNKAPESGNTGFKAGIVTHQKKNSSAVINTTKHTTKPIASKTIATVAKVVTTKKAAAINPADILDDISDAPSSTETVTSNPAPKINKETQSTGSGKSYIQFAALSSPEKADSFKQTLASKGINASVQPITTNKGTLYRLRAGPFNTQDAKAKLKQISAEGYSGIVTSN